MMTSVWRHRFAVVCSMYHRMLLFTFEKHRMATIHSISGQRRLIPPTFLAGFLCWLTGLQGPAVAAAEANAPPEYLEMLAAILTGSQMGPGDGWFHPSLSRYDWTWIAKKYDRDRDGKITRKEFRGASEFFDRLDRDRDGVLTAEDFDWSERSKFAQQGRPSGMWFSRMDGNSNGRISREEWSKFFEQAAKGKGYLTPDDLRDAFPLSPPPRPKTEVAAAQPQGPTMGTLVRGLFTGELGSFSEGPKLNQRAPDFTLTTHDGKRTIRLGQFKGQKPVVLVFGSFT